MEGRRAPTLPLKLVGSQEVLWVVYGPDGTVLEVTRSDDGTCPPSIAAHIRAGHLFELPPIELASTEWRRWDRVAGLTEFHPTAREIRKGIYATRSIDEYLRRVHE